MVIRVFGGFIVSEIRNTMQNIHIYLIPPVDYLTTKGLQNFVIKENSPSSPSVVLGTKMRVISTDAAVSLPAKDGRAEILNSSLDKFSSLTVCARYQSGSL